MVGEGEDPRRASFLGSSTTQFQRAEIQELLCRSRLAPPYLVGLQHKLREEPKLEPSRRGTNLRVTAAVILFVIMVVQAMADAKDTG